jgi:hypothetical protein
MQWACRKENAPLNKTVILQNMGSSYNTCFASVIQEPIRSYIQWSAVLMVTVYCYNPAGTKVGTALHKTDNRQKFKFPMPLRLT